MSAEPEITQAQMDKYFETGGKEAPPALVEAEKIEAEVPTTEPVTVVKTEQPEPAKVESKEPPKADGEVQVNVDGKMVPLAELMEERRSRQAAQQLASQQQQQLTEMLALVREKAKTLTQAEQTSAPDPNSDPFGYINHVLGNVQQTTQELQQWRQAEAQARDAANRANQVLGWAQSQANSYTQTVPDYPKAMEFARQQREKELEAIGLNPNERQQMIEKDTAEIIQLAMQKSSQGIPTNPAELVYKYAQAKGYKADIVAAQKTIPDLDDKVKTISRGQEAARGVGKSSGGAPTEINTLADLAGAAEDMSDEEFSKAFDKLVPKMKGKYV